MKKRTGKYFAVAGLLFLLFALFTAAVMTVDVRPIGPEGSRVGLASVNEYMGGLLGSNLLWYRITDWLGMGAILVALGFAGLGAVQMIRRRDIRKVDGSLLALGGLYAAVVAAYALFEVFVVNYRPILMDGVLEPSYPSSHTMIVLCVLGAGITQLHGRIRRKAVRRGAELAFAAVIGVTIAGRLLSGVHWFTDIVGGLLLGSALLAAYCGAAKGLER